MCDHYGAIPHTFQVGVWAPWVFKLECPYVYLCAYVCNIFPMFVAQECYMDVKGPMIKVSHFAPLINEFHGVSETLVLEATNNGFLNCLIYSHSIQIAGRRQITTCNA